MNTMTASAICVMLASGSAALASTQSYDNLGDFLANAGSVTLETFEGFASGTTVTSLNGISQVNGVDRMGTSVDVNVVAEGALPFPMFTPGTLPSGTNFLSNNLDSPSFATGTLEFVFDAPTLALGFFVADTAPLDTFNITLFNGTTQVGSFNSAAPLSLPGSFFGVAGDMAFTSAVIGSNSANDSWGIDDLYVTPVPSPGAASVLALAGVASTRRRR